MRDVSADHTKASTYKRITSRLTGAPELCWSGQPKFSMDYPKRKTATDRMYGERESLPHILSIGKERPTIERPAIEFRLRVFSHSGPRISSIQGLGCGAQSLGFRVDESDLTWLSLQDQACMNHVRVSTKSEAPET